MKKLFLLSLLCIFSVLFAETFKINLNEMKEIKEFNNYKYFIEIKDTKTNKKNNNKR